MWLACYPGNWTVFEMAWPWLGNSGFYQPWVAASAPPEEYVNLWYDQEKERA